MLVEKGRGYEGPWLATAVLRGWMEPAVCLFKGSSHIPFIFPGLADYVVVALFEQVVMGIVHDVLEGFEASAGRV